MSAWSKRRKFLYLAVVAIVLVGAVFVPAFLFLYHAPTCSDGKKNGDEQGIDCGGSCQRICQINFIPPVVSWARFEKIAPGIYNAAAYLINENTAAEAVNVPYHMVMYDKQGLLIKDVKGTVTLPPHRNTLAFLPGVNTAESVPAKILFEFTAAPDWHKRNDPLSAIDVGAKDYSEDQTGSSLSVLLKNESVSPLDTIAVYAVLYDKDGNAIGFSKTKIDEIIGKGSATAPFTWPTKHGDGVISIEVLPVQE